MKRKNLTILTLVFVLLILITLLVTLKDNPKERGTFRSELLSVNPEEITQIQVLSPKTAADFSIVKKGADQWEIEKDGQLYTASPGLVSDFLNSVTSLKAKQVVANSKKNWQESGVEDSVGTRVKLLRGNVPAADFIVGRMNFSQSRNPYQQYPDAFSYFRFFDEETVYSVEGMLSMTVNQEANDFRDGQMVTFERANLTRISFHYPSDSSFQLQKTEEKWFMNELPTDSAKTYNFLNSLQNFSNRNFEPLSVISGTDHAMEVKIEGNNMETIHLKAFPAKENNLYVISSLNKEAVFRLEKSQWERLFRGKTYFLD